MYKVECKIHNQFESILSVGAQFGALAGGCEVEAVESTPVFI